MKPDPSLPRLPSLGELLKHPTVERIVDRVNQTTIAQRATGFLEELQSGLQQRTGRGVVPSIHQVAERLARRLLGDAKHGSPIINATGAIWGERLTSPPLAERAVHAMVHLASEYHEAASKLPEQVAALLAELTGAEAVWIGHDLEVAASLARESGSDSVDVSRHVGLVNPATFGLTPVETIADRLKAGADLVVCDGAGLLGGPACGLVVGRHTQVMALREQPSAANSAADMLTLAALHATLEIYQSQDQVVYQIPAMQLLSTPLENLQQRCERLASLLGDHDAVEEACPTQCNTAWYDTGTVKFADPTWALKLRPVGGSSQSLAQLLRASSPAILGREQQDAIWLDLRAVFPRWDQQLVAAVEERSVEG